MVRFGAIPLAALVTLASPAGEIEEWERLALSRGRGEAGLERMLSAGKWLREQGRFEDAEVVFRVLEGRFAGAPAAAEASRLLRERVLRVRGLWARAPGDADPHAPGLGENRITIHFLGEGFPPETAHQEAFEHHARTAWRDLFRREPFREYAAWFEGVLANLAYRLDEDGAGWDGERLKGSTLGARVRGGYLDLDPDRVEEILRVVATGPWQAVVVGNFTGASATGGNGISALPLSSLAALAHELGHSLGGLHDEYEDWVWQDRKPTGLRDPSMSFPVRARPPNLVEGSSPPEVLAAVPWRHWIERGVLGRPFLGGGYSPLNVWRPAETCIMRKSRGMSFCAVCREALVLAIHRQVSPIDRVEPPVEELLHPAGAPLVLSAAVLRPRTHDLLATWSVAGNLPRSGMESRRAVDAWGRDLLTLVVPGEALRARGTRRFTIEVRDPTPWVLRDDEELLVQTWTWTVQVTGPETLASARP